jgi:hypothetical protein
VNCGLYSQSWLGVAFMAAFCTRSYSSFKQASTVLQDSAVVFMVLSKQACPCAGFPSSSSIQRINGQAAIEVSPELMESMSPESLY